MTLMEKIQKEVSLLPPEKQNMALEYILSLQKQAIKPHKKISLRQHPAYGSWRKRNINALNYEHALRSEWN
ncbi:MAG: hypothetical protein UZ14_CFX002002501 [Chloroflexi bacterium OLB14]|nr:MAG: hypothetical protein UZ14_CFX002002501 [Chloroflexi bacterium OLB14]